MSLAESAAAFEQHCNKLIEDGSLATLLRNNGIRNLSALAFSTGTPQMPPTDDQFNEFAARLNGGIAMGFGMQAALRRLHFEASAIIMAELKARATDTSGDGTRKLPVAEKTARLRPGSKVAGSAYQRRTSTFFQPDRHGGADT